MRQIGAEGSGRGAGGGNARTGGRDGEEEVTELVGVEHVAHRVDDGGEGAEEGEEGGEHGVEERLAPHAVGEGGVSEGEEDGALGVEGGEVLQWRSDLGVI